MKSKTISIRLVEEMDAQFILQLRLNTQYSKYLTEVSENLDDQINWIRNYKEDERSGIQYYFIIELNDGTPCGTVRIYDIKQDSFGWGSWILNESKTRYAAIESAFLVYKYGFEELGFKKSHFDVMKGNVGVISFHKKMGAKQIGEDECNFYFEITKEQVELARQPLIGKLQ